MRLTHKFENMGFVGQPVEQCGGQALIAKHLRPVGKTQVGGHQQGYALIDTATKLEDQLRSQRAKGDEAEFVDHYQLVFERLGDEAVDPMVGLRLQQVIDQASGAVKAYPVALFTCRKRQSTGDMGLAQAGIANQHDRLRRCDVAALGQVENLLL